LSLLERREQQFLDVFVKALTRLRFSRDLPRKKTANKQLEDLVSDRLAVEAKKEAASAGLSSRPLREVPRQPISKEKLEDSSTGKRPDFTWPVRNHEAQTDAEVWVDYHVECKLLGERPSKNWVYNRNYANKGIRRFLDPKYKYGYGAPSGAMIGYVMSMTFDEILNDVNDAVEALPFTVPRLSFPGVDFPSEGIARASQKLKREQVTPEGFDLRHLWVDLRCHEETD
jgi:hypothetical protein